ncbi:hypothetical protein ACTACD_02765 [Pseudomonas syringae]
MKFLEKRRDVADGAPLFVDVPNADSTEPERIVTLLERVRNDPHVCGRC